MAEQIPEAARHLVDGTNFGHVATVMPDGALQSTIVWLSWHDDMIAFSTVRGRQKTDNLARDPRMTISVHAQDNPYEYLEVRGTADVVDDPGTAWMDTVSNKYIGKDYPWDPPDAQRVIVRLRPDHVVHNKMG